MSTLLRAESTPSTVAPVGGAWVPCFTVDGDATPTVTVTRPDASPAVVAPVLDSPGCWYVLYTLDIQGRYTMHVATPEDALDFAVYAYAPGSVPTAQEVMDYLGGRAGGWTAAQVDRAYRAELGAQRDKTGELAYFPDQLREALCRRVSRNLAMRNLPLAMAGGDADVGPSIVPGADPEVRRLEAPWRKLVIG